MYLAYVTGAGEAEALSFGLQTLSTASKTQMYGEPMSGPAGSTQELEIQGSGDHLQQPSKCKPSWWLTDPLKEINKMIFLFFSV